MRMSGQATTLGLTASLVHRATEGLHPYICGAAALTNDPIARAVGAHRSPRSLQRAWMRCPKPLTATAYLKKSRKCGTGSQAITRHLWNSSRKLVHVSACQNA